MNVVTRYLDRLDERRGHAPAKAEPAVKAEPPCPCCGDDSTEAEFDADWFADPARMATLVAEYGSVPCTACCDDAVFCDACGQHVEGRDQLDDYGWCSDCSPTLARDWAEAERADYLYDLGRGA